MTEIQGWIIIGLLFYELGYAIKRDRYYDKKENSNCPSVYILSIASILCFIKVIIIGIFHH